MNYTGDIKLISDSSFVYSCRILIYVVTALVASLVFFVLFFYFFLFALLLLLPLFFYYSNILKNRKIEIYKETLSIKVSSYFDAQNSFFLLLKKVNRVEKIFPGNYSIVYYEDNEQKKVLFKSLDLDLKFILPFTIFFENNSDVTYLTDMVNWAKQKE